MSTDRERNIVDMFDTTLAFNTVNASDYVSVALAAVKFAEVQAASDAIKAFFAAQTSGERAAAVEQKSVLKAAANRKYKTFSKAARALNLGTPGFDKLFNIPSVMNEDEFVAYGRECVKQATDHKNEFAALGITLAYTTSLEADLDAIEAAKTAKATAQATTVGATAGIDAQVDIGMAAETVLDAIMHHHYQDDPVKLAAWTSARHVKRAPQPATPPTP